MVLVVHRMDFRAVAQQMAPISGFFRRKPETRVSCLCVIVYGECKFTARFCCNRTHRADVLTLLVALKDR